MVQRFRITIKKIETEKMQEESITTLQYDYIKLVIIS